MVNKSHQLTSPLIDDVNNVIKSNARNTSYNGSLNAPYDDIKTKKSPLHFNND